MRSPFRVVDLPSTPYVTLKDEDPESGQQESKIQITIQQVRINIDKSARRVQEGRPLRTRRHHHELAGRVRQVPDIDEEEGEQNV